MNNLAIKIRNKWIKDDPELMAKFVKNREAVKTINALAMVVSDYKKRKST